MRATIFAVLLMAAAMVGAQTTYKLDKKGDIIVVQKGDTTKAERVYKVVDGVTFYIGAKGGVYYYRTSKESGKKYRVYLRK